MAVRRFRKRYAVTKMVAFLSAGKHLSAQFKTQLVVKHLYSKLRIGQRFARSFLECNRDR